jgi:hypothetical protein
MPTAGTKVEGSATALDRVADLSSVGGGANVAFLGALASGALGHLGGVAFFAANLLAVSANFRWFSVIQLSSSSEFIGVGTHSAYGGFCFSGSGAGSARALSANLLIQALFLR